MAIANMDDFKEFLEKVDAAENWSDIEPEEYEEAWHFASINPSEYGDPDKIFEACLEFQSYGGRKYVLLTGRKGGDQFEEVFDSLEKARHAFPDFNYSGQLKYSDRCDLVCAEVFNWDFDPYNAGYDTICDAHKRYRVDCNCQSIYAPTLQKAKDEAEDWIGYTQCNVSITDTLYDTVVSILPWFGVPATDEDEVAIDFGDLGFYGAWTEVE